MRHVPSEPDFLRFVRQRLPGETSQFGCAERWCAPLAVYDSPVGFGDEIWVEELPDSVLAWRWSGDDVTCEWGNRRGRTITGPSHITLQARGALGYYACPGPVRFAHFVITPSLLDHVASRLTSRVAGQGLLRDDLVSIDDPVLRRHLDDYAERSRDTPTRLEMEARAVLVVERLLTRHHDIVVRTDRTLIDWRLRRATEYLEARLAEDVGLADLSDAIGLGAKQISNLFVAGVGEPPHRWLMRRRFERACEMLADPRQSVTEIAHACGFASSQHLATVFRKRMGMTPTGYRRERLS